jgi:hypothetical protein
MYKPLVIEKYCALHEWILYLDADAAIVMRNVTVQYFIEGALPTTTVIASYVPPRVNNGIFLLRVIYY